MYTIRSLRWIRLSTERILDYEKIDVPKRNIRRFEYRQSRKDRKDKDDSLRASGIFLVNSQEPRLSHPSHLHAVNRCRLERISRCLIPKNTGPWVVLQSAQSPAGTGHNMVKCQYDSMSCSCLCWDSGDHHHPCWKRQKEEKRGWLAS